MDGRSGPSPSRRISLKYLPSVARGRLQAECLSVVPADLDGSVGIYEPDGTLGARSEGGEGVGATHQANAPAQEPIR